MNILIATDLSAESRPVIDYGKDLAKKLGAKIWLLHIAEPDPTFVGYDNDPQAMRKVIAETFHQEHNALQRLSGELRAEGLECTALLVQGPVVSKILSEAEKLAAEMIILGSHGYGAMKRLLVGSTSESLLEQTKVPLVVIPTH